MNTTLFYALLLTGASVLLNLGSYFAGLQTDLIRHLQIVQWLSLAVIFALLYLGADAKRKERANRAFTYGQAFVAVFLIGLLYAALNTVPHYAHFKFIHPDFADYMIDFSRSQMIEQGIPDAQIEAAEKGQRMMMQPGINAVVAFAISIFMTVLLALLHAMALVRRRTLVSLLVTYALVLGCIGLVFGGLGGLMKGGFVMGALKGFAINAAVGAIGWGVLLKATSYAPDAPPEEPSM